MKLCDELESIYQEREQEQSKFAVEDFIKKFIIEESNKIVNTYTADIKESVKNGNVLETNGTKCVQRNIYVPIYLLKSIYACDQDHVYIRQIEKYYEQHKNDNDRIIGSCHFGPGADDSDDFDIALINFICNKKINHRQSISTYEKSAIFDLFFKELTSMLRKNDININHYYLETHNAKYNFFGQFIGTDKDKIDIGEMLNGNSKQISISGDPFTINLDAVIYF